MKLKFWITLHNILDDAALWVYKNRLDGDRINLQVAHMMRGAMKKILAGEALGEPTVTVVRSEPIVTYVKTPEHNPERWN